MWKVQCFQKQGADSTLQWDLQGGERELGTLHTETARLTRGPRGPPGDRTAHRRPRSSPALALEGSSARPYPSDLFKAHSTHAADGPWVPGHQTTIMTSRETSDTSWLSQHPDLWVTKPCCIHMLATAQGPWMTSSQFTELHNMKMLPWSPTSMNIQEKSSEHLPTETQPLSLCSQVPLLTVVY